MAVESRLLNVARFAGLRDESRFSMKTAYALTKSTGATQSEGRVLTQIICLVLDDPLVWDLVKDRFLDQVEARPELHTFYNLAKDAALAAK